MKILATFKNGKQVIYTYGILSLLLTDPGIDTITDYQTGIVLYQG